MARKDILKGLMAPSETKSAVPAPKSPARPTYSKGAVGAVSRSIGELKARAIVEVPADMIDDTGGLKDRLGDISGDHVALVQSIADYGQQVPVLLRVDPNNPERYQVVYGRRRVAALRELGQPVKALVRDLNDRDLIMAQGQENAARRDLTFIEKANFARQMRDAGFERKLICDALHIDKTVISRMLTVADTVTEKVIRAIGPAPGIGRDRWLRLVAQMEVWGGVPGALIGVLDMAGDISSDARFEAALAATAHQTPAPPPKKAQDLPGGLGTIAPKGKAVALTVKDADFGHWLAQNIQEIHRRYKGGE